MKDVANLRQAMALAACLSFCGAVAFGQQFEIERTLDGHTDHVHNLRFSPDGKTLASCSWDGGVVIWDLETGRPRHRLGGHGGRVIEVTFSPNGRLLGSCADDGWAKVWDAYTGELLGSYRMEYDRREEIPARMLSISFVTFSRDSRYVFFGGVLGDICRAKLGRNPVGMQFPVVSLHTCKEIETVGYGFASAKRETRMMITGGMLTQDGQTVIVSGTAEVVGADGQTGRKRVSIAYPYSMPGGHFNDVNFGPLPNTVATWSYEGKVTVWNYKTGQMVKAIQVAAPQQYSAATFDRSGRYLATGVDGSRVNVWNWKAGSKLATLTGNPATVSICRFSPVDDVIAVGCEDGSIVIWRKEETEEEPEPLVAELPEPVEVDLEEPAVPQEEPVAAAPTEAPEAPSSEGPSEPEGPTLNGERLAPGKIVTMHIQFEQGKYYIMPDQEPELDELAATLKKYPSLKIEVRGHTDNVGDPSKNMSLSERRATAVRNYLIYEGVEEERIVAKAFGGTQPIASNEFEDSRRQNRRVEVKAVE